MSNEAARDELQEIFQQMPAQPTNAESCPPPEQLWAAVRGELDATTTRQVVAHTSICGSCAEAWRLGRQLVREAPGSEAVRQPSPATSRVLLRLAAGLAALGLALTLLWPTLRPQDSVPRNGSGDSITSRLAEDAVLPRQDPELRWSGPEEARFRLWVTTEQLQILVQAENLDTPEYRLPADLLADLPAGTTLLWQVEATLPDGTLLASPTFRARLE